MKMLMKHGDSDVSAGRIQSSARASERTNEAACE